MEIIGKGIYSLPVAAKLLEMPYNKVYRWAKGYKYSLNNNFINIPSLIKSEYEPKNDFFVISFLDLIELLFIKNFLKLGVSLHTIRKACISASELLNSTHPFAMKKFYTDGKTILAKIAEKDKDPFLLDLLKKQYKLDKIINHYLKNCIDFNEFDHAERWWPIGKEKGIVLDPNRNLGQPILNKYNIRTDVICDLYMNNHNKNEISEWYNIDFTSIENAIRYEKSIN